MKRLIIIGGEEFPAECPPECPFKNQEDKDDYCYECPIFNCVGPGRLLDPDEYRKDWAKIWKKWFDGGMKGLPELF